MHVIFKNSSILMIKDLSIMYHALWDWRHKGATRIRQCTRRVAQCALMCSSEPWVSPISQCTVHHALILLTWIIWFWYIMKPKFVSEVLKWDVANHALWKIYAWICESLAQPRLCDVIMISVSLNLYKMWMQISVNGKCCGKFVL